MPPKYFPVPIAIMDGVIGIFDFLAKIFPQLEVCCIGLGAWFTLALRQHPAGMYDVTVCTQSLGTVANSCRVLPG